MLWVHLLLILSLILTVERNKRALSVPGFCCWYAGLLLCAHHLNVLAVLLAKVYCGCITALHKQLKTCFDLPIHKDFLVGFFFFSPLEKSFFLLYSKKYSYCSASSHSRGKICYLSGTWYKYILKRWGRFSSCKDSEGNLARMKGDVAWLRISCWSSYWPWNGESWQALMAPLIEIS